MHLNIKKIAARWKKAPCARTAPYAILTLLLLSYVLFFSTLSLDRHNRFASLAFDLGIFDQAIWQFSTFVEPFNTVRGIHIFGDHFTPINALISPLYWFFDNVRALLVLQTIALAAAAIPLFLIARNRFKSAWIPLLFCAAYLLYPALHYVNLEDYHPEAFIPVFLLFAFYFVEQGRKWPYFTFLFLALFTREETALTTFLLGAYVYCMNDKRTGIATSAISLLWFLFAFKIAIPFFNDTAYWHTTRVFGEFGDTPLQIIMHLMNPAFVLSKLWTAANASYLVSLFAPVGFLAFLNPATLVISAYLWVNLIAAWPYSHSIQYHYVLPIIPFVFLSAVIGVARFKTKKAVLYPLLALLVLGTGVSNYHLAPFDSSIKNYPHILAKMNNFNKPTEQEAFAYHLLESIPENASVTASYHFVPHLSQRQLIYNFPNPFKEHYWGDGTRPPPEDLPEYIILRQFHVKEYDALLQQLMQSNTYERVQGSEEFSLFAFKKPQITTTRTSTS